MRLFGLLGIISTIEKLKTPMEERYLSNITP